MPHTRYIVVQHKDEWLIKFGDEEYGPYHSQAEAMLFAIDAAQKLGEQGENTQVGSMGDAVLKRTATRRPCLRPGQRLLWVVLSRWWADWQRSLVLVQPATVLRWRRRGLWLIWGFSSHHPTYNGLRLSQ